MHLHWLESDTPFPPVQRAWGADSEAPGLLAAGADLSVPRLLDAYQHGIFPWFSEGQPILWWSPEPRMVLPVDEFHIRRSFAKVLRRFIHDPRCEIRINHDFAAVMGLCAQSPRKGQPGTWIVQAMQQAYHALHRAGHAHSVETWIDGQRVGGLYCVAIGRAVFGESMFSHQSDASKIALAALVALCRHHGVRSIDCQQVTAHLASLGARPMPRAEFMDAVAESARSGPMVWDWKPLYWNALGLQNHRQHVGSE